MNFKEIITQVAIANNTTPEEVYSEMQIALDAAFQNPDPNVQKEWATVPLSGNHPRPEDVIPFLAMMLSASKSTEIPRKSNNFTA